MGGSQAYLWHGGGMCLKIILQGVCERGKVLARGTSPHGAARACWGVRSHRGLGPGAWGRHFPWTTFPLDVSPSSAGSMTPGSPFAARQGRRQSPRAFPLSLGEVTGPR